MDGRGNHITKREIKTNKINYNKMSEQRSHAWRSLPIKKHKL